MSGSSPAVAPPPGNPRFALFDSLRGIAVLAVLAFHSALLTGELGVGAFGHLAAALGPHAVIVFFVISGFLLYRPYLAARAQGRARTPPPLFWRRRVLRIVPAYWLALTVLVIFPGVLVTGGAWRYYLFLQLYDARTLGGGIPVAWTICVEVTFYLSLPLWAWAMARARPRRELLALALVAVLGFAVQVAAARQLFSQLVAESLPGQSAWFALGMALAIASVAPAPPRALRAAAARPGLCWLAAIAALAALSALAPSGGLFAIIGQLNSVQPFARVLARIVLALVLVAGLLIPAIFDEGGGGVPRRVLAFAPLAWIGMVSYGIYLWHLTLAELIWRPHTASAGGLDLGAHVHALRTPLLLVMSLAGSAAIAAISYRFVELPFLRRKEPTQAALRRGSRRAG